MIIHNEWEQYNLRLGSFSTSGDYASVFVQEPERSSLFTFFSYAPDLQTNNLVYYMENAMEFLDSPGEWYLDTNTGTLYYMPRVGEDISSASIVA
jgi:hypothetical protein